MKKALKYNEESCNPPLDEDEVKTIVDSMIKTDKTNKANNVEKSINESKLDSSNEDDLKVDWISFDETGTVNINDKKFAEWYVKRNELYCINDRFYTRYGQISDNEFRSNIHNIIGGIITTHLSAKVESLLASVKNEAFTKLDAPDKYKVQFDNISFDVRHGKLEECDTFFTLHQIPHNYDAKADCPKFKRFINNLFYEEDIPVIQEYLGYCLVPNTLAQTALFIIGEGGEGKSRIPVLMEHIIGADNVVVGDFEGLQDKFSTSSLDKQMLFMDDELTLTALDDTSNFKKIVTAETAMEVEVKGKPKYKTKLYSRIICCGNGAIQSKFDRTDGFYRRLLLCKVRPVHYDKPDRTLSDQLDKEIPGIINWMLEGLCRVVKNGFIIEPSKRMSNEVQSLRDNSDTIQLFMNDEQFIDYTFDEEDKVSIKQLYDAYENWCQDNSYLIIHKNTFGKTIRRTYKSTLSKKLMNPQRVNELISKEKVYIMQVDSPQKLYNEPNNLFVAGFIGSPQMNFIDTKCKVEGDKVSLTFDNTTIVLPPAKAKKLADAGCNGKTVVMGIRPEDIGDSEIEIEAHQDCAFEADVTGYELLGSEVLLYFKVAGTSMTAKVDSRTTARMGDHIKLAIDPEKIHVFDKETELTITN